MEDSCATILLTGASGFLGSRVLEILLEQGKRVVVLGRRAPRQHAMLDFVAYDFAQELGRNSLPWDEIDVVAHLAAAGVKAASRNWPEALAMNVIGTQYLLSATQRFASRVPAFFMTRTFYEKLCPEAPALRENPYIASKAAASQLVEIWSRTYGGSVLLGNVFQVYGPGDDDGNVLTYAARHFNAGRLARFGSGSGLRDWIYVEDAAHSIVSLLSRRPSTLEQWDIGTGALCSVRRMVEMLIAISGVSPHLATFEPAQDRQDLTLTARAERFPPGWRPDTDPEQGLTYLLKSI